jgi:hypothetical protein
MWELPIKKPAKGEVLLKKIFSKKIPIEDYPLLQLLGSNKNNDRNSLNPQSLDSTTLTLDTLTQELAAIQQTGSKRIALLGSRHVPLMHQQLIEMMSYALVLGGNSLVTSGATGTNAAAIKGAMRAESNLLTVILPQSLARQPRESQQQLEQVVHLVENPDRDSLSLGEASALCNREIVTRCQQLICFAFHDSHTLLQTCREAEDQRKIVTLFYFD